MIRRLSFIAATCRTLGVEQRLEHQFESKEPHHGRVS